MKNPVRFPTILIALIAAAALCRPSFAKTEKTYYASGQVYTQMTIDDATGKTVGNAFTYYENGQVHTVTPYVNGMIQGEMKEYYKAAPGSDPQLAQVTPHEKSTVKGTVVKYYPNGAKQEDITYDGDKIIGTITRYYPNGRLSEIIETKDGQPVKHTTYYDDGRISGVVHYKNGQFHGKQQFFYKNAQLSSEITWDNGVRKETVSFDEQGFPIEQK